MRFRNNTNTATLLIDGEPAGRFETTIGFVAFISWSGLDIGRDRSSPVSHYEAPFAFTGKLRKVTMTMDDDQALDAETAADCGIGARIDDDRCRVASWRRQPLRLATRHRVDAVRRAGRRRASTCR